MRKLTAQWIANAVGGTLVADVDAEVTSVTKDSRDVTQGSLYVAFIGERVDGHAYVQAAVAAGAALCLVSQPVAEPHVLVDDVTEALGKLAQAYLVLLRSESDLTVVGITGSNGKTTTKDLLGQILPQAVIPAGSLNNEIGLPLTVLRADADTRYLVLEMGASGIGHIEYLTTIAPPDIVVVLLVGRAHFGAYDSLDVVAQAKAEIIRGRMPGGTVVLNGDDFRVREMQELAPQAIIFGREHGDVRASSVRTDEDGFPRFTLEAKGESAVVQLKLIGEHHVSNALAAAAVAVECGISVADIAAALSGAQALSAHRMHRTVRADGVVIIDDSYNASPESVRAALRALRDTARGRTVAILGEMLEMGDSSIAAHDEVGGYAVRLGIDQVIVVGIGAKPAYEAAVREGSWGDEAVFMATIDEARDYVQARLNPGDTVLVKGSHGSGLWQLADELTGVNA